MVWSYKVKEICVPELSFYSELDWAEVSQGSSAVALYRSWLDRSDADSEMASLRLDRHRAWLRAALATFFDNTATSHIVEFWSYSADKLISEAWRACGLGDLPVALIALGKLGAEELNLSSDVDLMVISEIGPTIEIDRALRKFRTLLAENTDFGFVLRLDFDLRPGGRFGPIVSSLPQVEDYYWSQGETWERLALVRARILQGPPEFCDAIMDIFVRFCYRKFLDYTLLDDLKQLRSRIHQHYHSTNKNEFNIKLGVGGIRDIELFVHALQVIHGGRDRSIRTSSTKKALLTLRDKKILPDNEVELLDSSYWLFRHLEHMVQLGSDRQSHLLNFSSPPSGRRFANQELVQIKVGLVNQTVTTLLGSAEGSRETLPPTETLQRKWLSDLGFSDDCVNSLWADLVNQTARSMKLERDESARRKFLYDYVEEIGRNGVDKELALSLLLDFTQSIRAKATFFSLFVREPRLVRDLARLFSSSPYLGRILASRPELIDSFLFRTQERFSGDLETRLEEMAEHRLLTEIIAANQFLVDRDSTVLCHNLSACADYICSELLQHLDSRPDTERIHLVAMGKWGGMELGFRSDLDLLFVSKSSPDANDHKVAKRFIHRLNDFHKGGKIYSIDLRLRPSGQAGPLIVSQSRLEAFLKNEALHWERQAYLRARPLSHLDLPFADICCSRGLSEPDLRELKRIRTKLIAVPASDITDLKLSAGGLIDIELAVQARILFERIVPSGPSMNEMMEAIKIGLNCEVGDLTLLHRNYLDLRAMEQMAQLSFNHSGSQITRKSQESKRLACLLKKDEEDMHQRLAQIMEQSTEIIKDIDPAGAFQ
jgi:glutamate-ammonia-ligase adenylyltransferase